MQGSMTIIHMNNLTSIEIVQLAEILLINSGVAGLASHFLTISNTALLADSNEVNHFVLKYNFRESSETI